MVDTAAAQEALAASALAVESGCMASGRWGVFVAAEWAGPGEEAEEGLSLLVSEVVV
jgi:hypothetical protein